MASAGAPRSHMYNAKTEIETDYDDAAIRSVEVAFDKGRQLGQGTYGKVYLATDKQTGEEVALKKIKLEANKEKREGFPITAIREIRVLMALNHPNVINLKEIVRSNIHASNDFKGSIYLVFEYMQHDLAGLHERLGKAMPPALVKWFVLQLLQGLQYCHSHSVLHRDLKASNLLINDSGDLKLADFGLARPHCTQNVTDAAQVLTHQVCTLWYRPPELLLGCSRYGGEVDIWSTGCILYELLTGEPLFNGRDEANMINMIFKMLGFPSATNWPEGMDLKLWPIVKVDKNYTSSTLRAHCKARRLTPDAIDLLEKLLRLHPAQRIRTEEAIAHPYFTTDPEPMSRAEFRRAQYLPSHEFIVKGKDKRRHLDSSEHEPGSSGPGPAQKRHATNAAPPAQQAGLDAMLQDYSQYGIHAQHAVHAAAGGAANQHMGAQQLASRGPEAGTAHLQHAHGMVSTAGGRNGGGPPHPTGAHGFLDNEGGNVGMMGHAVQGGLYGVETAAQYGAAQPPQQGQGAAPGGDVRGNGSLQGGAPWGRDQDPSAADRNFSYRR